MLKDPEGNFFWKPSLKQEKFLSIPLSVKEAFYAGAVNAGKSDVLLMYPIVHGWHKHPQFKGIFFRRTMPELRNEIIPRAIDYFRHFGATYNKTEGIFTFPSGALYYMAHCENEKDVHKYDSMQPNYAAFDELTSFTEWIYLYITIERVRVNEALKHELPMIVRSGSNPGNIGHPFVYKRFIKPSPQGYVILKGRGGIKRVFIPATIDDNPYASVQYKAELDALPEAERRAKKYGDWTAYEGQVFDEFRDKQYPNEPANAVHIVSPFEIPAWWPRILAIDWGFAAMCSVGWGAISPDKRIYVYRHQFFYRQKIEEWAPQVRSFVEIEQPNDAIICHSAEQHRGDPHSIIEQVQEALQIPIRLGEKNRVAGKQLLHEYLRWQPAPISGKNALVYDEQFAMQTLRNFGQKEYEKYIMSFVPKAPETNLPKLQFFNIPDVKIICDTIKACVYEKSGTDGKKKEDVQEFDGDDPYDMLRMLLHAADQFFEQSEETAERLGKINEVVEGLRHTQDMTSYYRNMRALETAGYMEDGPISVKRYHGARTH